MAAVEAAELHQSIYCVLTTAPFTRTSAPASDLHTKVWLHQIEGNEEVYDCINHVGTSRNENIIL